MYSIATLMKLEGACMKQSLTDTMATRTLQTIYDAGGTDMKKREDLMGIAIFYLTTNIS